MKILFAVDSSPYAEMAALTLNAFKLPQDTKLFLTTVVPEHVFVGGISLRRLKGISIDRAKVREARDRKAREILNNITQILEITGVDTSVLWGRPEEQIIKKTSEIQADLVVIGARGEEHTYQFPLGNVAQKVMKYTPASVLLVRERTKKLRRVMIATDGSKYSSEAIDYLLRMPLPGKSQIFIVTSLESHIATWIKAPTLDMGMNRKLIMALQAAEEKKARTLLDEGKRRFEENGYEAFSMLLKGEPASEILTSADTIHPDLIVIGAKGVTGVESFLLGGVAQRVARFSRYSVLIYRGERRASLKRKSASN